MSLIDLEPAKARAGQLFCSCDGENAAEDGVAERPALMQIALGFGLTVIVQSLYVAVLPIAGAEITEQPALATLPYALTLVGALAASLPAAMLTDVFGRKSAFALGASLGLAGACLAAWSISERQFAGLALGSFWLGVAQGFGFFFRHSAALAAENKAKAIAIVLGAGSLAAIAAPALLSVAQSTAGPLAPAAALLLAGAAQIVLLALCLALPGKSIAAARAPQAIRIDGIYLWATLAGALAWLGMALMMAGSPGLMAGCGIGLAGRSEVISWHILAMYAPAAILGLLLPNPRGEIFCALGVVLLAGAIAVLTKLTSFLDFGLVLIVAGSGWSLTMFGATLMVHAKGALSRPLLALHDAALFGGAIAGAMAAAFLR
ncbi:MAG: MFS transporter [Methylovirgula sp.]